MTLLLSTDLRTTKPQRIITRPPATAHCLSCVCSLFGARDRTCPETLIMHAFMHSSTYPLNALSVPAPLWVGSRITRCPGQSLTLPLPCARHTGFICFSARPPSYLPWVLRLPYLLVPPPLDCKQPEGRNAVCPETPCQGPSAECSSWHTVCTQQAFTERKNPMETPPPSGAVRCSVQHRRGHLRGLLT